MLRAGCGAARGGCCPRGCAGVGRAGSCAASRGAGRLCPPPPGSPLSPCHLPPPLYATPRAVGQPPGGCGAAGRGWGMGRGGWVVHGEGWCVCAVSKPFCNKGSGRGQCCCHPFRGVGGCRALGSPRAPWVWGAWPCSPPRAGAIAASCTRAAGGSCLGSLPPARPLQPPGLPAPCTWRMAPSSTLLPPPTLRAGTQLQQVTVFICCTNICKVWGPRAPPVGSSPHGAWLGQGAAARAPTPLPKAGVAPVPKPPACTAAAPG